MDREYDVEKYKKLYIKYRTKYNSRKTQSIDLYQVLILLWYLYYNMNPIIKLGMLFQNLN